MLKIINVHHLSTNYDFSLLHEIAIGLSLFVVDLCRNNKENLKRNCCMVNMVLRAPRKIEAFDALTGIGI